MLIIESPHALRDHTDWVYCVAFSPDGRHLASVSDDGTLCCYDMDTITLLWREVLPSAGRDVHFVGLDWIVVGCNHGEVVVYDVHGAMVRTLERHLQSVYGIASSSSSHS